MKVEEIYKELKQKSVSSGAISAILRAFSMALEGKGLLEQAQIVNRLICEHEGPTPCYLCDNPAVARCRKCHRPICKRHLEVDWCVPCDQNQSIDRQFAYPGEDQP